jgi:hypothetical protein
MSHLVISAWIGRRHTTRAVGATLISLYSMSHQSSRQEADIVSRVATFGRVTLPVCRTTSSRVPARWRQGRPETPHPRDTHKSQFQDFKLLLFPPGGAKAMPSAMDDISFEMNFDSETARRIREIAAAKEHAVRIEDYDTAKRLKVIR